MRERKPPHIIVDSRELNSNVVKSLDRLGADIEIETMPMGDYCVSDRCCIERKEISDFFNSLFSDRKLFSQLSDLADAYERPILIFEGGDPFTSGRQVNPKAVQGILNAIALMRIPILYSIGVTDTANIIYMIAAKEQSEEMRAPQLHGKRSSMSKNEQLIYSLSSIPGVGAVTARNLLEHFETLSAIVNSDADHLQVVKLVGKNTAANIKEFFEREYKCE